MITGRNKAGFGSPHRWGLGASLALNLALAGWLWLSWRPSPATGASAGRPVMVAEPEAIHIARKTRADAGSRGTAPQPSFHWSQVESADYREYIANLRALGCPEQTIHDLITADLRQLYGTKSQALFNRKSKEYWQKWRESDNPTPELIAKLRKLDQERQEVERDLLGSSVRGQQFIDLLFLQVHGTERELTRLPADRRAAAAAALEKAGLFQDEEAEMEDRAAGSRSREQSLNERKWKVLSGVLSADELKELQAGRSGTAGELRNQLRYFEATQSEFDALLEAQERQSKDPKAPSDYYAKEAARVQTAKQVLGEKRGQEYERATDLFYIWSRNAVTRFGLPEEAAAEAWQVKSETMAAANRVRGESGLDAETRQARLDRLQQTATDRLTQILGQNGARFARAGDGVWLQTLGKAGSP